MVLATPLPQKNPKPRAKAAGRVKTALTFPVTDGEMRKRVDVSSTATSLATAPAAKLPLSDTLSPLITPAALRSSSACAAVRLRTAASRRSTAPADIDPTALRSTSTLSDEQLSSGGSSMLNTSSAGRGPQRGIVGHADSSYQSRG